MLCSLSRRSLRFPCAYSVSLAVEIDQAQDAGYPNVNAHSLGKGTTPCSLVCDENASETAANFENFLILRTCHRPKHHLPTPRPPFTLRDPAAPLQSSIRAPRMDRLRQRATEEPRRVRRPRARRQRRAQVGSANPRPRSPSRPASSMTSSSGGSRRRESQRLGGRASMS
jgi:hypothetical protein